MTSFLIEILSEEIPAKMQLNAINNFKKIFFEGFNKSDIKIDEKQISAFVSPRRISLIIKNLEHEQIKESQERIGPKVDANQKAIDGFLKSVGLEKIDDLSIIEKKGSKYYLFKAKESTVKTKEIIEEILPSLLQKMTNIWPKLMRYQAPDKSYVKWVRPVRNLLAIFGDEIINLKFFGLTANNNSFGHFLYNQEPIKIDSVAKYEITLEDNFVIVNHEKRKKTIINQINKIKYSLNLETTDDENSSLIDEVNGLCEWPNALVGEISEKFMNLPREILILTLKQHQKFFCLQDKNGELSQKFIFIAGAVKAKENEKTIISDNEKISKARLEDALFFVEEDLKILLSDRFEDLKNIVFNQKLGTIYEKSKRIEDLAEFISLWISFCEISKVKTAAMLCKTDLLTKSVAEFPELQGKIGNFYARKQNIDKDVATAIEEHYLPIGSNSEIAKTPLGISLAIADKLDSIVGLFLANQKPTSSKDPFALRRAALGIIRICLENNIAIPFRVLINKSLKAYKPKLVEKLLREIPGDEKSVIKRKKLSEEITKFFIERLKNFLKDSYNLRADILNSVIDQYIENFENHKYGDMVNLARRAAFVNKLVAEKENNVLITLYKRSANVLSIEEKKDNKKYSNKPNRLLIKLSYEKNLYNIVKTIKPNFKKLIKLGEYQQAFELLKNLEQPLTEFFDNVTVNDENHKLRENRLLILAKIRDMFLSVADFSKVEL